MNYWILFNVLTVDLSTIKSSLHQSWILSFLCLFLSQFFLANSLYLYFFPLYLTQSFEEQKNLFCVPTSKCPCLCRAAFCIWLTLQISSLEACFSMCYISLLFQASNTIFPLSLRSNSFNMALWDSPMFIVFQWGAIIFKLGFQSETGVNDRPWN